ncbi:hypothetical protein NL676_011036 [Syzygium grande]|nr:hypothetical protein NL676_011036 [Syzygium grande]
MLLFLFFLKGKKATLITRIANCNSWSLVTPPPFFPHSLHKFYESHLPHSIPTASSASGSQVVAERKKSFSKVWQRQRIFSPLLLIMGLEWLRLVLLETMHQGLFSPAL